VRGCILDTNRKLYAQRHARACLVVFGHAIPSMQCESYGFSKIKDNTIKNFNLKIIQKTLIFTSQAQTPLNKACTSILAKNFPMVP